MLAAGLWATLAASSLLLGAFLAMHYTFSGRLVGCTMGFGAGALIGALAYELIPDKNVSDWGTWLSFGAGALLFFAIDELLQRHSEGGAGVAIALGALLDGVPESIVLGISVAVGGDVGFGFLAAVFVSNVPESLSATVDLQRSHSPAWLYRMWAAIAALSGVAAALGYTVATRVPGVDGRYAQALAAGAVLTMLSSSMTPEAVKEGGRPAALLTALGFAIAAVLTLID